MTIANINFPAVGRMRPDRCGDLFLRTAVGSGCVSAEGDGVHLENRAIAANDGDVLSAGSGEGCAKSEFAFPRPLAVDVVQLLRSFVGANDVDFFYVGTDDVDLIGGGEGNKLAVAAISQMHDAGQKRAGRCVP